MKIFYLFPRRFPLQAIVSEITHKPILFKQGVKPVHEGCEVVRLEKEVTRRSLTVDALAYSTKFPGERTLVVPVTDMFNRRIGESQVERTVDEAGIARIALNHDEFRRNLLIVEVQKDHTPPT